MRTIRDGTAPMVVLGTAAGVTGRIEDVGIDFQLPSSYLRDLVRRGSGRIDREDALTAAEVERTIGIGRSLAEEEVNVGADLLVPATVGAGATTPASVLVAALAGVEPVAVVGRGSGIDDAGWMRKAAAIHDALRRARPHGREPLALLRVVGGVDLAVLTGFLAQAAVRRTPVVLDGLVVGAAAMLAEELAPGARRWWVLAERSPSRRWPMSASASTSSPSSTSGCGWTTAAAPCSSYRCCRRRPGCSSTWPPGSPAA